MAEDGGVMTSQNAEQSVVADEAAAVSRDRRSKWQLRLAQLGAIILVLAIWQGIVEIGLVRDYYISKPSAVATTLGDLFKTSTFYSDVWVTVRELLYGLVIGVVCGTAVGFALGAKPFVYSALSPILTTLYILPRIALISLFILWFGLGPWSKVALVISLVFFSMMYNAYAGLRGIERRLVDNIKLLGGGTWTLLREIYLPGTLPWLFAGLRISLVFAVTGAVVGEMLASTDGLGHELYTATYNLNADSTFALLVVIAALANIFSGLLSLAEKRLVRGWGGR